AGAVEGILDDLTDSGNVARGVYTSGKPRPQWVNKANLEQIHRLTMRYLKRELAACAPYEVVDFMTRWQHLHPATRLSGPEGLRKVIRQLQGIELVTGAIEPEMLAGRVADYKPEMLERLIAAGEVCWRRIGVDGVKRGRLTLCIRKDMPWLAAGAPVKFDTLEQADADIPEVILAVRDYFRRNRTAFFDDVVAETGLDADAVMRSVWYLAWCGELTCDTYECVRHSNFQVTLSACYDLDSTPRKILSGRITAARLIRQMNRRKLDPRLGRWWATERLVPPKEPLPAKTVLRKWGGQLLRRWGIVSRDILAIESAAPPWGALAAEFKRLELLGKVTRGYFIEGHQGAQYGLPEAVELLRDCRARRSDGKELGYLPDEPLMCVTSRDPANLYAWCLDVVEQRGQALQRRMRRGNLIHRLILQAGQVLIYEDAQLAELSRRQLFRCLQQLQHDFAGREVTLRFRSWNGHPIDVSPVAAVLWELGFRFDGRGEMVWPAPARPAKTIPDGPIQDAFLPHYAEPAPVEYGPDWLLRRASDRIRPTAAALLELLSAETAGDGWEAEWTPQNVVWRYR
ncbi:hypothetical protein LCGC14_2316140, partial [marine sediment metagenome]